MKPHISDELWNEFHRVVNMTPRELEHWLRAESLRESTEGRPGAVGSEVGWQVLDILSKPRADLSEEDVGIMESITGRIRLERRNDLRPTAGDDAWRARLMALGHDPYKDSRGD
jgi:hypothetical protein